MVIPRERIVTGDYLTRLYVLVPGAIEPGGGQTDEARARRQQVTLENIFKQARDVLGPYSIKVKEGTEVDWWAAYQIGQRLTPRFSMKDSKGRDRLFIGGDGQGMNVSMMDGYNLAWKLAYAVNGLTPDSATNASGPDGILETYHSERHTIAQQLIDFDKAFSSMFSGKITADATSGLSHDEFLKVFSEGNGFTSGCGIEYPEGILVDSDDFISTGRFRVLCMTTTDLLDPKGQSAKALESINSEVITAFPTGLLELVVLHPSLGRRFDWHEVSPVIKKRAEMTFHGPLEDAYEKYGVSAEKGALAVVRPDGYVGIVSQLEGTAKIREYLARCIRTV
ncbi:hypothetical protein KEM55_003964 [Ascosphaera atra]|nr:hypothetical protein KEM55_003964 [Ascosphaera atra]